MTAKPLVSLCCSTYSRPDLFRQSLDGLLRQTYSPLEILVLVDGANPDSLAMLRAVDDPRLRWLVTDEPSGMIPAWNKVVGESKGRYFLYCADDDVLLNSAIDKQVDLLETNPTVGFCHADFQLVDDDGQQIGDWVSHEGTWVKAGLVEWPKYLRQPRCCMQTTVVRKDLWERVGGWDEDAGYPGDNSLYLKLLRISDVGHVSHFACQYRVRTRTPDSWVKNSNKVREDVVLARRHLDDPPSALAHLVSDLHKQVNRHFMINAITVLADSRASAPERVAFIAWVRANLLGQPGSNAGLYSLVIQFHLEFLVRWANELGFWIRRVGRRLIGIFRQKRGKHGTQ